jgi:MFS family permease
MKTKTHLWNKDFVLLWQGQAFSQLGSQGFTIAAMFWIKHTTGSATQMGVFMMLTQLPAVLLGVIGGSVADRFPRKRIIVLCDLFCGLAVLSLALLMLFKPSWNNVFGPCIIGTSIVVAIFGAFFRPAINAVLPDLVPPEQMSKANSLYQISGQSAALLGQALGGVLYRIIGAPLLFLLDGISSSF